MSEVLGGERDSQDSNPGSLNLESGFQPVGATGHHLEPPVGWRGSHRGRGSLCQPQRKREWDMELAVTMPLSFLCPPLPANHYPPTSFWKKETQESDTGFVEQERGGTKHPSRLLTLISYSSSLHWVPPVCLTRFSVPCTCELREVRSLAQGPLLWRGEGWVRTQTLSNWWHAVPSLSLWELSTPCKGFLTEILGSA